MMASERYRDAVSYFSKLDETGLYSNPNTAITNYINLINNTKKFKNLTEVSKFMTKKISVSLVNTILTTNKTTDSEIYF